MRRLLGFIALLFLSFSPLVAQPSTLGEPRFLAILVEFKDLSFSLEDPALQFGKMLNEEGYSDWDATGSVRDFYVDNSQGLFSPSFDVFGPVTLDNKVSVYGRDIVEGGVRVGDAAPEQALYEACLQLDGDLDFSQYDADGDGLVDLILFIYAGYDQAVGGPQETLWAQQWSVQKTSSEEIREALFDEVKLGQYIAVSELKGSYGEKMAAIGPICHELGHYLGLPDFYDANGAEGGHAGGVYNFSPMSTGMYNNEGRIPPYFNALELRMLGWIEGEIPELPEGLVRLAPVQEGAAFRSPTATEGEYFLYEYRSGTGWDSPLPEGLLIYHVDQSERPVGPVTAREQWEQWEVYNSINAFSEHPCFYLIPSSNLTALEFSISLVPGQIVFPGLVRRLFYDPVDWDGGFTDWQLCNIGLGENCVQMHVLRDAGSNINGVVKDASGRPVEGAVLTLEGVEGATDRSRADGFFTIGLPEDNTETIFSLSAVAPGFHPEIKEVSLDGFRMISVPIDLKQEGEADDYSLSKYDRHARMGYFSGSSVICAVRFSPEELAPYTGQKLSSVSFYPYLLQGFEGEVFVTVDIGKERVLTQQVENPVPGPYFKNEVDVSEAGIVIPEGLEMYIGYGSPKAGEGRFFGGTVYPGKKGNSFYSPFSQERSTWQELYVKSGGMYMDVALSGVVTEQTGATSLADLGMNYIDPGTGTHKVGEDFPLNLVTSPSVSLKSVNWTFDNVSVSGSSVQLKETGTHSVKAYLHYQDGREEILELLLKVN